ncbi:Succinoglycan biosynthesis protein [Rubellimicrobium mesophilum DSM 19309]|uniref:Succinoglycan biosynthesis protein n=1 Tax=Rubellimicrobium mesophilum DSM 19309 TaxID=442562 RepID=A0A017HVB5_9RHOB|nr:thermonuclease family protein [Rubellimicrobium mesophilum]EYD78275.1 Succinoglycan biosynthesis protein [Rubellimicrobium mesophilum DSM 19309]
MAHRFLILAAIAALFGISVEREAPPAGPHGRLRVIDADTYDVGDTRVRLHGVDAPEKHQTCLDADGAEWDCGAWAIEQARARWEGRQATCEALDTDRYGRTVARCMVGGADIGAMLVAGGMALAYRDYSTDYVVQEAHAQGARVGVWRGQFRRPEDYRRDPDAPIVADADIGITDVEVLSAPEGCEIKGNISPSGRIYHLPGSALYGRTTIDESKGERWFCSPDEAEAAGWRPAR